MKLNVPELALVVLVGPSGSGKSTFAAKHFKPTEVLSSDVCRGLVSDDENDQSATRDAFEVLHFIAGRRLENRKLTVVDATNVQPAARRPLVRLAREHDCLPVAIVLDVPERVCQRRNQERPDRDFGRHVIGQQVSQLRRGFRGLKREGFREVHVLEGVDEIEAATIERTKLWTDRREERGPFDLIGDVHGCHDELLELLEKLGWEVSGPPESLRARHPEGRKAVFLGDLVDRGPKSPQVLRLVMAMVEDGTALCVPGNHDVKLMRKLWGRDVKLAHGLAETLQQLEGESEGFRRDVAAFIRSLVSHYVLDGGDLVVAHAGLTERLQGRASPRVRDFALYGETTGETDEFGLPVRHDWAAEYRGTASVVYGHTPVPEARWVNRTLCIDTGCVFGGKLSALRYPERELVDVAAHRVWCEPVKPIASPGGGGKAPRDLLDVGDVAGKRIVTTRVRGRITIREDNAAAALEVMSRFAIDPHWLIYLPPTMSPVKASPDGDRLESPSEAFAYYRKVGVSRLVCQEKHMGSRAVLVVCRDGDAAARRFAAGDDKRGVVYSRTGRPFFPDDGLEVGVVDRVAAAMETAGLWERLETDWVCLDAEIMPWSVKARGLLETQYAPVGAAGTHGLDQAVDLLARASRREGGNSADAERLLARMEDRRRRVGRYVEAYRRYCWPVDGLEGVKVAPFHLMASEGGVHTDRDHLWHMETLTTLAAGDPDLLVATPHRVVDLDDPDSQARATAWWEELTGEGGEGMVVKAMDWLSRGRRGLAQPAVKCRGREYLRIIYGPEYTAPEHLNRLRGRSVKRKRSLALREYALGLEGLHRFVEGEPLYRVHECAFGVLALESEPVDPRL